MHNQFYFLHLDKTIAKTAGIRLFDPMYPVMEENGISAIELNATHERHNYWRDFDKKTFIFSVLRDPVTRTLSEFCWWANYGNNDHRTHNHGRDSECPTYTKENLVNWLYNIHRPNYQSSVIGENYKKINMLIRAEDIKNNENTLRNTIMKSLGVDYSFPYYSPDFEKVFMQTENRINSVVDEIPDIIKEISALNYKDVILYSYASDAWLFNDSIT